MFKVDILQSQKELSAVEKIRVKDTAGATKLDAFVPETEHVIIGITNIVQMHVTNDKLTDPEYDVCLCIGEDGTNYITGSESFISSVSSIIDDLADSGLEYDVFDLEVYKLPSKNYQGRSFIKASLKDVR